MLKFKIVIVLMLLILPLKIIAQEQSSYLEKLNYLENNLLYLNQLSQNLTSTVQNLELSLQRQKEKSENTLYLLKTALLQQKQLKKSIQVLETQLQTAYQVLANSRNTILQNEEQFNIDIENLRSSIISDNKKSFFKGLFIGLGVGGAALIILSIIN